MPLRRQDREYFLKQLKPTLRFGQVPCLVVDGEEYVQCAAILKLIARRFDQSGSLYPSDPLVAAKVDAISDAVKARLPKS